MSEQEEKQAAAYPDSHFDAASEVVLDAIRTGDYDLEMLVHYWGSIGELNGLVLQSYIAYQAEKAHHVVPEPNPIRSFSFAEAARPDSHTYTLGIAVDAPRNRDHDLRLELNGVFRPLLIVTDNNELWDRTSASLSAALMDAGAQGINAGIWQYRADHVNVELVQTHTVDLMVWAEILEGRKDRELTDLDTRGLIVIDSPENFRAAGAGEVESAIALMASNKGHRLGAQMIVKMSPEYFLRLKTGGGRKTPELGWVLYKNMPLFFGGMRQESAEAVAQTYGRGQLTQELESVSPDTYSERRVGMMPSQLGHWDGVQLTKYWMLR